MVTSFYWIKLYHEILDDPKMGRLRDRLWRRVIECFLLAGELHEGGWLPSLQDMAWRLHTDPETLEAELSELARAGILEQRDGGWFVSKFAERQAKMDAAERMRRMRKRRKKASYYGKGTDILRKRYAFVTTRNTDTDTDTDTDTQSAREGRAMSEEVWNGCVDVMEKFSDKTGIKLPDLSRNIRRNAENWVAPANEIMLMCDDEPDEATSLIASVIEYMDENGLTYANVGSTVNIARRIRNGGANGSGPKSTMWDEHIYPYHDKQKPFDELPDEAKKIVRQLGGDDVQSMSTKKLRIRYYTGEKS